MDYFAAVKTFVLIAELGSLTRAAQELVIKTSTASRHVTDLEADLRIALFNRSTRGLSLTEGGRTFYAHVAPVLVQLQEAREVTSALNLTPSGVLRVTMPNAFGRRHILPHLGEFMARYPGIQIDAVLADDILNLIEARIDLGIRIGTLNDSSLMARRLGPQRLVACASPAYLQKTSYPAAPAEMMQHRCLLYSRAQANYWYAQSIGKPKSDWQKLLVSGPLTLNDDEALLDAAVTGLGIALLPGWLAAPAIEQGLLQRILPKWHFGYGRNDISIWAVYPPKKTVSSKVRSFIDFLAEKLGDLPPGE